MDTYKLKISKDALINATNLRNNNLQQRNLKEVITEIIKRISQELISAHRDGNHHIITTMPITFSIPNMSNSDSQRYIYASVIDELISKDYRIWIAPGKNACRIKITWMSPADETEMKYQTQLIAKHTMQF
jgi:hypothetical protein